MEQLINSSSFRYSQVKQFLIDEIKHLSPHDRIASRNVLAQQYTVARTTIERAISELIGEGYLYSKDGSGTYVAEYKLEEDVHRPTSNKQIGVIIPDIMQDFYPGIIRGIEDTANRIGLNVILCNADNDVSKQSAYMNKLMDMSASGLILVPAVGGEPDLEPFKRLQQLRIPFVFCNRGYEGISAPLITSNNFFGAYTAVKHLIAQGYTRIAYISSPQYSTSLERYQGYISAMTEADLPLREEYTIYEPSHNEDIPGYASTSLLLDSISPPDAIFCFNDRIATGAYRAAAERGMIIGKEFGLIGCNNSRLSESLPVKLTSLKFNTYEIGKQAIELLNRMIEGKPVQRNKTVILPTELMIRESCERLNC